MNNDELKTRISELCEGAEFIEEGSEFLNVIVPPEKLHALAESLKYNDDTKFDFLFCLSGVDWITHLMVVYHLTSSVHTATCYPLFSSIELKQHEFRHD